MEEIPFFDSSNYLYLDDKIDHDDLFDLRRLQGFEQHKIFNDFFINQDAPFYEILLFRNRKIKTDIVELWDFGSCAFSFASMNPTTTFLIVKHFSELVKNFVTIETHIRNHHEKDDAHANS